MSEQSPTEARQHTEVELSEHRAVLPGEHGLECIVYEYIADRTVRLRQEVYVTFVVEDGEFRPGAQLGLYEHTPRMELQRYQAARGLLAGEWAYGKGRPLEVAFMCYSPPGSGAAEEAVTEVRDALEKLREVATWPESKRSWFGVRHGVAWLTYARRDGRTAVYRPPAGVLPYRSGPPQPPIGYQGPARPHTRGPSTVVRDISQAINRRF